AIAGGIVALVVIGAVANAYIERRRTEAFKKLADDLNFEFFPAGLSGLMQELSGFHLFNIGHCKLIKNHLRAAAGGIELNSFDYRYTTGSAKSQQVHNQSVLVARSTAMDL